MKLTPEELDELVQKAEEIVSQIEKADKIQEAGKTQMSNAIDVARSAKSFGVFINWLRYQSERQSSKDFWTRPTSGGTIGKRVADFALRLSKSNDDPSKSMEKLILFLGFMRRAVVAQRILVESISPFIRGEKG